MVGQTQLTPPPNAYDMSAGLLNKTAGMYDNIAGMTAPENNVLQNVNSYMNPFYDQVINSTLGRMDINREKTLGRIGDQAQAAGAFGGSRHGVMEGEFLGQDQMNRSDMIANMQMQNYNQGLQNSRQDWNADREDWRAQVQNQFGAAQGNTQLGSQYFNIGNAVADRQNQAGSQQQALLQMLLSGGADRFNEMVNQPSEMINLFAALNSGDPRQNAGTNTQSSTPGLFDYLSLAAGMGSAYVGAG